MLPSFLTHDFVLMANARHNSRHVYYMSWLLEFFISATLWTVWNWFSPPAGAGEVDTQDAFDTFRSLGIEESVDAKVELKVIEDGSL